MSGETIADFVSSKSVTHFNDYLRRRAVKEQAVLPASSFLATDLWVRGARLAPSEVLRLTSVVAPEFRSAKSQTSASEVCARPRIATLSLRRPLLQ